MNIEEAKNLYEIIAEQDLPCIVSSSRVCGTGTIIDLNLSGSIPLFKVVLDKDKKEYLLPCFAVELKENNEKGEIV